MSTGLLATKLYIPPLRPSFVARPRLVERLRAGLTGKLTLVVAPAGFGKTTLLSEALGERPVAWVSLDAGDSDATRFWSYVLAALDTLVPGFGDTTRSLFESPRPPALEAILITLLNASAELNTDATLVLDDYHVIDGAAVHEGLSFLLEHLPPRLHLVIATRADPPLRLARLRARAELNELRAADLRFTPGETTSFLNGVMELPVSTAESAALERRTEGWIAGLQLAALAMRGHAQPAAFIEQFTGSNRFVVDYLAEEVFERQPPHLQTFLLQTSILERLCGPLCDALLLGAEDAPAAGAQAYSQALLEELERSNLFIVPLDDERRWYRYHQLFVEVLRSRLQHGASDELLAMLHMRASVWYEEQGSIDEAVRYALHGSDLERAAVLVERHAMALILESSNVFQARAWIELLPRGLIVARPRLVLAAGVTLILTGRPAAVEQLLADAAPVLDSAELAPGIAGEVAVLRSTIGRFAKDAETTLALARQALDQLAADNHAFRAVAAINSGVALLQLNQPIAAKAAFADAVAFAEKGESWWIALGALEELGSLQLRQAQLRQALASFEQAVQLSARLGGRPLPATGIGYVGISEVLYERNDLDAAMQAALRGIELLRGTVERGLLVRGYVVLAQIQQAHGDGVAALESIQRCREWFAQSQLAAPNELPWLEAFRARLWLRQGNLAAADDWAHQLSAAGERELELVQQLTLVRLRLARGEPATRQGDELDERLARLLALAGERGWIRYQVEILILKALLCRRQGDLRGASSELEHAMALVRGEGFVRSFVDQGAAIGELLARVIADNGERRADRAPDAELQAYAQRLLAAFAAQGPPASAMLLPDVVDAAAQPLGRAALPEQLTERELEVLRLVAGGLSNQDIADRLVVAVSTVKKHLNNIYGKLETQSRTQAIACARELELL